MTKLIDIKEYAQTLFVFDNILILTHAHPDGDTAGTGIALACALTNLEKNAIVLCADELPQNIKFLENYTQPQKCFFGRELPESFVPEHVLTVDVASNSLLGDSLAPYSEKIELALDHHEINTLECENLFVEPASSSAGETMFYAIRELEKVSGKKLIDKNCACALYTALASDSGNFKFSSVSGRTMIAAGELIDLGAENAEISRRLFDIKTPETLRAEAICIENMRFFADGFIAFSHTNLEILARENLKESDFDSCVQVLRTVKDAEVAVFAKQKPSDNGNEKYRISMRSNQYFDVAEICAAFGGGGHKKAAGCTVFGTLDEVAEKIVSEVSRVMAEKTKK